MTRTKGEMWPRTDLLELLGITYPIIQAPMSGFGGPALVAAVSNAGALGSLGCVALPTQTVRDQIKKRYVALPTGRSTLISSRTPRRA
jgi:NAD(P)H-dependent flavin oxidoreductase YrpB (nitropropane dioxygenase family)